MCVDVSSLDFYTQQPPSSENEFCCVFLGCIGEKK